MNLKRSSNLSRSTIFFILILVGIVSTPNQFCLAEKSELDEKIDAAIQNPGLRDYFRERLTDINTVTDAIGRQRTVFSSPIEEQVDRMARVFLRRVWKDLESVKSSFEITQEHRWDVQSEPAGPSRGFQLEAWRSSLRALSETVKDLRKTVRPVLAAAYRKSMKKGAVYSLNLSSSEGLQSGFDLLEDDMEFTLEGMQAFFFESKHTVSVTTLTDNDLLIVMERIESLAKDLARHL